jgi:hypothetical protein
VKQRIDDRGFSDIRTTGNGDLWFAVLRELLWTDGADDEFG